jgi:signal transduction histidine kinase
MVKLKVLIVDDEPGMRLGASRALKKYQVVLEDFNKTVSFEVDCAGDGEEALERLENDKYDLAFLDYKLPGMTGLDILGHIRSRQYDLLAIMITAYASLEVAVSATKNGAFDFLAKPFTPDELKAVARKAANTLLLQREARRLAEEKRQVRFQFLSVLSHELKAPLNAIEGYLHILDDRVAGNDLEKYDNMVKRSLSRIGGMRKLIFDLLDLTRIESGQKQREVREVNIIEAVSASLETIQPNADDKNITLNLHAPDTLLMNGDLGELEIIFNNLISNAVKYNKDGGKVDITISKADDIVTIKVADTGIGMKPEEKDRLFEEFVRIKNEKTRDIEGSGLGLSILKRLSALYSGNVSVESEFGVGSTFTMHLKDSPNPEA